MSTNSGIEWTEATWNCLIGCTKVSPGCLLCYAMTMAARIANAAQARLRAGQAITDVQAAYRRVVMWERGGKDAADNNDKALPKWNNRVELLDSVLHEPLTWKRPKVVFVNSMSDLFHESVPFEFIDKVFAVMALTPHHTYQVLTKRPERMAEYLRWDGHEKASEEQRRNCNCRQCKIVRCIADVLKSKGVGEWDATVGPATYIWQNWPLPNVWLGTSCENQQTADERIPHLLRVPAAVRFLSLEPLLGPIDLTAHLCRGQVRRTRVKDPYCDGEMTESDDAYCVRCNEHLGGQVRSANPTGHRYAQKMVDDAWSAHRAKHGIHWVICGGESGANARPMNIEWARSIVSQCKSAGVPVFVKQLGARPYLKWSRSKTINKPGLKMTVAAMELDAQFALRDRKGGDMSEWPEDLRIRQMPRTSPAAADSPVTSS